MDGTTQSPEADLDREIERLAGELVRGTLTDADQSRLIEFQSRRGRLMDPTGSRPRGRVVLHWRRTT